LSFTRKTALFAPALCIQRSSTMREQETFLKVLRTVDPNQANITKICEVFDQLMRSLPVQEQLVFGAAATQAIVEIISVRAARSIGEWEQFYSPIAEPTVSLEMSPDLFVQSQTLDLEHLFEPHEHFYPSNRQSREGSVAGELDKETLLEALDQHLKSGLTEAQAFNQALSIAHVEDITAWTEKISAYLNEHQTASLDELSMALALSRVETWMTLLLGAGFTITPVCPDEFYGREFWVSESPP
jgi:hypothetical protein